MDYLITIDTGDKYLVHHGTKGMKWGKWNAETAARYAGGTRSDRTVKFTSKAEKHRMAANEFRNRRDRANADATIAMAKRNNYLNKSERAAKGGLLRAPNPIKAAKMNKKASRADRDYEKAVKKASKLSRKYNRLDRRATRYEVKAYKSDANDSSLGSDRKTVRDLKKHRISMNDAKARTKAKVNEALKSESVLKQHQDARDSFNQDLKKKL